MSDTYADEQATQAERPAVHGRSVGELVGEVSNDLSTLMRQELALAKAEVKAEAAKTGKAAGMLGGAGFAGYMVALFVSIALWWALANGMDEGWAALIVAALWAVVGAVLYSLGRSRLKSVHPKPERTVQTLKKVPDALKGN
jgi:Putative Actinobacterial Holin-X, holin superfamily III